MAGIYWLASYPKSGNTWFRAFLRNLIDDAAEPADINDLVAGGIASSRGWLDEVLGFDTAELTHGEVDRLRPEVYRWSLRSDAVEYHKIHDAYVYTTHDEPLIGREATLGALYIVRNPLDVAHSAANHWNCTIDQAIERMGDPGMSLASSRNRLPGQVRQRLRTWSEHVLSWVDAGDLNCLVIRYEDMLMKPQAAFGSAAGFLNLCCDPTRLEKAIRFSDLEVLSRQEQEQGFRERPQHTERFFRRERNSDWRTKLTPEQVNRVIADQGAVMHRLGYLSEDGRPV